MATGKYAKVIDKLPRMLGSEPAYQVKVEAVKQAMVEETERRVDISITIGELKKRLGVPHDASLTVEWTDGDGWHDAPFTHKHIVKVEWQQSDFQRHASALARDYAAIRGEKARIEDLLKEVNLRLEAVSQMLFDQYEAEGVTTMTVDGRPVAARLVPYATVSDREAFQQWCLADQDLSRKMSLPWQTINKVASDMLVAGEEPPPGITIWAKQRFTLGSE